jgi:hypothetical protein
VRRWTAAVPILEYLVCRVRASSTSICDSYSRHGIRNKPLQFNVVSNFRFLPQPDDHGCFIGLAFAMSVLSVRCCSQAYNRLKLLVMGSFLLLAYGVYP